MSTGVPADHSDWLTFTEMHEENCGTSFSVCVGTKRRKEAVTGGLLLFVLFLVFCFLPTYYCFFFKTLNFLS